MKEHLFNLIDSVIADSSEDTGAHFSAFIEQKTKAILASNNVATPPETTDEQK